MPTLLNAQDIAGCFNVAIVASRFNEELAHALQEGAVERLKELGFTDAQITIAHVPAADEIPIVAQRFAQAQKHKAIICLGAVIFGETHHFDQVCKQVHQGCQHVALQHNIPVISGLIFADNVHHAQERVGGKKGHAGREAAEAAFEMVSVLNQI